MWATVALTLPEIWQQACAMAQELTPQADPEQAKNSTGVGTTGSASEPVSTGTSPTPNSSAASSDNSATSERVSGPLQEPSGPLARTVMDRHPLMTDGLGTA
jgi:hypothetical protein